jgi:hypothetical protein
MRLKTNIPNRNKFIYFRKIFPSNISVGIAKNETNFEFKLVFDFAGFIRWGCIHTNFIISKVINEKNSFLTVWEIDYSHRDGDKSLNNWILRNREMIF